VDYTNIPEQYLKSTTVKDGIQTCTYQAQLLHEDFPVPLNVVIIVKRTSPPKPGGTSFCSAVISSCACEIWSIITSLRFQIEFPPLALGRETVLGLEDFMNVNPTP